MTSEAKILWFLNMTFAYFESQYGIFWKKIKTEINLWLIYLDWYSFEVYINLKANIWKGHENLRLVDGFIHIKWWHRWHFFMSPFCYCVNCSNIIRSMTIIKTNLISKDLLIVNYFPNIFFNYYSVFTYTILIIFSIMVQSLSH